MNLRDLEYLVSLAEHKHFTKAARASFATQPTLSMQIKKLETELGVTLVERTNRKVMITPLGRKIVALAAKVIAGAREIESLAHAAKDPLSGDFKVGAFPTLAPYLLPRIVPGLKKDFPALKLILLEEKTEILIQQLEAGKIDAAFLALPVKEDSLDHSFLFNEEFYLAVAKSRGWDTKKVRRSQLKGKELLLLAEGHCLRDQALEFCERIGASETLDFRASSLETLRQMVSVDVGMTLIPKLALKNDPDILYLPFEKPKPFRKIGLFWRKSSVRKALLKALRDDLKKILPESI